MTLYVNLPSLFRGKAFFYLFLTLVLTPGLNAFSPGKGVETVILQFEMDDSLIRSEDAYRQAIETAAEKAMAEGDADLLIFPEYLGVFSALIPWRSYLVQGEPFEQVWRTIRNDYPEIRSIRDLFSREDKRNSSFLDDLWGSLALRYKVYILAGSRFTLSPDGRDLYNTAIVYGPDGGKIYQQNKYFLTDFETGILGLTSGDPRDCRGFMVKERLIRLTICRDTFLTDWESLYDTGYLWIDIKANGVPYTPDQAALFTRALPSRLKNTTIPWGITACLTGHFLDLLWEGESNIIYNRKGKVEYRARSRRSDSFEIIRYNIQ